LEAVGSVQALSKALSSLACTSTASTETVTMLSAGIFQSGCLPVQIFVMLYVALYSMVKGSLFLRRIY